MASSNAHIDKSFPDLISTGYSVTSSETPQYNCIAWAAGLSNRWCEPDSFLQCYWPPDIPREYSVDAYSKFYEKFGYIECDSLELEEGYEKIALYIDANNVPSHAARQLNNGMWTSKLGKHKDIQHNNPSGLEGRNYGKVYKIFKKKV